MRRINSDQVGRPRGVERPAPTNGINFPSFRNLRGDPFERDELVAPIDRWQEQDGLGVIGQAVLSDFAEILSVFPPASPVTTESVQAALDSLSAAAAQH